MATPINTILSWFETGDTPTQSQFAQAWTSFWHKDEVLTPYQHMTFKPQTDMTELVFEELIGAELDAVMYRGQVDMEEIQLDSKTGKLSNWHFRAGVKYIIFYTKR